KWDDKLAEVSQTWIESCYEKGHSDDSFRERISGYKGVGENMAYSWSTEMEKTMQNSTEVARIVAEFIKCRTYREALYMIEGSKLSDCLKFIYRKTAIGQGAEAGWSDSEAENFRYGSGRISGGAVTSHFTQVIWAETTHVGCAVGYCKSDNKHKLILNCNYYPNERQTEKLKDSFNNLVMWSKFLM
uniref:SCP domain-containing protein n=1 Tax=Romanomermis culicivorax TaxID=13658 RepID=A0A915ICA5_ROMCU